MSAALYGRDSAGVTRQIKKLYANVGGVNRELKELWARDSGGVNRKIFSALPDLTVSYYYPTHSIGTVEKSESYFSLVTDSPYADAYVYANIAFSEPFTVTGLTLYMGASQTEYSQFWYFDDSNIQSFEDNLTYRGFVRVNSSEYCITSLTKAHTQTLSNEISATLNAAYDPSSNRPIEICCENYCYPHKSITLQFYLKIVTNEFGTFFVPGSFN